MVAGSGFVQTHSNEYTVRLEAMNTGPGLEIDFINLPLEADAGNSSWGSIKNIFRR